MRVNCAVEGYVSGKRVTLCDLAFLYEEDRWEEKYSSLHFCIHYRPFVSQCEA